MLISKNGLFLRMQFSRHSEELYWRCATVVEGVRMVGLTAHEVSLLHLVITFKRTIDSIYCHIANYLLHGAL